jgi:hypothetical protein
VSAAERVGALKRDADAGALRSALLACVVLLNRAEKILNAEFALVLQTDGSGAVENLATLAPESVDDRSRDVFRFERIEDLAEWLHNPRIVQYDDAGDPLPEERAVIV